MEIKREVKPKTWGTWEELLLASAVKRHGPKNWDSVALEVQARTALPATALSCKQKYLDLRRRFNAADPDAIPWLEDLRKLRVAELRQEVQRYDVSILSLESKVKRLEEERERSAEPNGNGLHSPDPDHPGKADRHAEAENRSVNESNSSGPKCQNPDREPAQTGSREPDPGHKTADSYDESADLRESSDVQSSASLSRKRTNAAHDMAEDKSRPLVTLLEAIRTHKGSSLFERTSLQTQEDERYKRTVRQHLDLECIEKKVEQGSYSSCTLSFYRDLMLLFNNAIVFFPKSSPEALSAHQLRDTVSNEMHKQAHRPDPPPQPAPPSQLKPELDRSDSLLAKHKSSAPIIVCRKRSSITAKPSSTTSVGLKSEEKKPSVDPKPPVEEHKEKPVTTGTRTMRRSAKNQAPNKNKKMDGSPEKVGTLRTEKKKAEAEKKKSAADFLKRIKRNSPVEAPKSGRGEQKKNNNNAGNKGKEKAGTGRQGGGGKQAKEESSPSKRSVGRPPKRAAVEATPAKRGRGEAAADSASKRPKKRAKR